MTTKMRFPPIRYLTYPNTSNVSNRKKPLNTNTVRE